MAAYRFAPGDTYTKDPAAVLEYKWDWRCLTNGSDLTLLDWLAVGETIVTATVTAEAGLTVDSSSKTDTNTSVTAWLSGGTVGDNYDVVCNIVTSSTPPRTDERTILILCRDR